MILSTHQIHHVLLPNSFLGLHSLLAGLFLIPTKNVNEIRFLQERNNLPGNVTQMEVIVALLKQVMMDLIVPLLRPVPLITE